MITAYVLDSNDDPISEATVVAHKEDERVMILGVESERGSYDFDIPSKDDCEMYRFIVVDKNIIYGCKHRVVFDRGLTLRPPH